MIARIAPEISQIVMTAPTVIQKSWRWPRTSFPVSSMTVKAAGETLGRISGSTSLRQTSSSSRNPRPPRANSPSGMSAKRTWNEIALAYVRMSFSS